MVRKNRMIQACFALDVGRSKSFAERVAVCDMMQLGSTRCHDRVWKVSTYTLQKAPDKLWYIYPVSIQPQHEAPQSQSQPQPAPTPTYTSTTHVTPSSRLPHTHSLSYASQPRSSSQHPPQAPYSSASQAANASLRTRESSPNPPRV